MRFRKKPVTVEAFQFTNNCELPDWVKECKGLTVYRITREDADGVACVYIELRTVMSKMRAQKGDWVVKGEDGVWFTCKPDVFEAEYEPLTSEATP